MKKLLLSLATVAAGLFTANAATVTFDFVSNDYGLERKSGSASDGYLSNGQSITSEDVTLTFNGSGNSWRLWTDGIREYRNNSPKMTVSAPADNVLTKVVFTVKSGVKITVNGSSDALSTWTGSAADVTFDFSTSSSNAAITKMEITYDEGEGGNTGGGDTGGGDEPVTPPAGEEATATFDFANNSYGLPNDANTYVTLPTTISEGVVEMTLTGNTNAWRYWSDGLREYRNNSPKFTLSLTNGGTITKVVITAKSGAVFKLEGSSDAITTWEGSATSLTFDGSSSSGNAAITAINVTYIGGAPVTVSAPKISCANNQVSITCDTPDAKIYYTTDGTNPSNSSTEYTVPFAITQNTTVKAIAYLGTDASTITSYDAIFTVSGIITVEQALALIENGYNSTATVKGYITKIDEVSPSFGNATYFIADEKGGSPELEVYRGYWMNGEKFTSEDQIEVDGLITVEGTLVNYNGTYEFTTGSKVIAYEAPDNGGDNPDNPDDPTHSSLVQNFTTNLGFPEGSANKPTTPTEYTATDTGITYTIMGCYANSGYLMLNGKDVEDAFISWTLETNLDQLSIKTTSGCSTNANNAVNFFAKPVGQSEFIQINENPIQLNEQNATVNVEVPWDFRWPGTTYKVQYNKPATGNSVNSQFASFTYGISTGVEGITSDNDASPVYYNLQGVRVDNPEKGIYIVVKGNKASKVIF